MSRILLLSGPSLDRLGQREPELYGTATLDELVTDARTVAEAHGHALDHFQTSDEEALVRAVRDARGRYAAIVINAAHYTHTSPALADALGSFRGVKIELHLTNPNAREQWRRVSLVAPEVDGSVAGLGRIGYGLALEAVCERLVER